MSRRNRIGIFRTRYNFSKRPIVGEKLEKYLQWPFEPVFRDQFL